MGTFDYFLIVKFLPYLLSFLFLSIISLSFLNWKKIIKPFKKINKISWLILLLIISFSFYIRFYRIPHAHRQYDDEFDRMAIGRYILEDFEVKTKKNTDEVERNHAHGFPFILAISFLLFGKGNLVAIKTNIFLSILTIPVIFLISYLLFKKEEIATYSALIFSLVPSIGLWSTTTRESVASIFFLSLTLFYFILYFKNKNFGILVLATLSLAFSLNMRYENIFLLPVFLLSFFLFDTNYKDKLNSKKNWLIILGFLMFVFLDILQFLPSSKTRVLVFNKIYTNIKKWLVPFFLGSYNSLAFSTFLLIGIWGLYLRGKKKLWFLIAWIIPFLVITILHEEGRHWIINSRLSMPMYISLSFIVGYGVFILSNFFRNTIFPIRVIPILFIFGFMLAFLFTYVDSNTTPFQIMETKLLISANNKIPEECIIFAGSSLLFEPNMNVDVIGLEGSVNNTKTRLERLYLEGNCIMLFYDIYCIEGDDKRSRNCNYLMENYDLSPVLVQSDANGMGFYKFEELRE